ncbi:hypothetical protein BLNAU_2633 [Blattamonas nauphoetae]|uniref:Uncharacterized protein n=1 Tax=Blattamonas nauphoetae TaxID=2049346 RepID=A0ABQ9YFF9_9EUKA|nr:hypothetical protein BLNAU_2633 [Blattamonas nauphoetae]
MELGSTQGEENEEEKLKMELISQGMNPQKITMMQMQGMSLQQIAEMTGKNKNDEDDDEEGRDEVIKVKIEAEEKKKAEAEEKENKKKKGRSDLTPQ